MAPADASGRGCTFRGVRYRDAGHVRRRTIAAGRPRGSDALFLDERHVVPRSGGALAAHPNAMARERTWPHVANAAEGARARWPRRYLARLRTMAPAGSADAKGNHLM